jgi:hypothetical protein
MSRQQRIENAMRLFYERPVSEQVIAWYSKKLAQEKKPTGQCVICKSLKIPAGLSGIGATFEKHEDGRLTAICGGRGGERVCPGYEIMREMYVDQATITSEIQRAMEDTRKELKIIRDRVLATEELSKEDEEAFRELTSEYLRLKEIEEAHTNAIEEIISASDRDEIVVEEDTIDIPDAYFGSTENMTLRTPMLPTEKRSGTLEMGEYPEMKIYPIRREDIPVLLRIDEGADDE